MLFYLLSRGLDRETAQSLLVYAFLADVLTGMSVSLGACRDRERADQPITRFANTAEVSMNNIALAQTDRDLRRRRRAPPISDPGAHGARQAAGLSGQRRLGAAPAMRDRRGG